MPLRVDLHGQLHVHELPAFRQTPARIRRANARIHPKTSARARYRLSYISSAEVQRAEYLLVVILAWPRAPEDFDIALTPCPRRGYWNGGRLLRRLIFGLGLGTSPAVRCSVARRRLSDVNPTLRSQDQAAALDPSETLACLIEQLHKIRPSPFQIAGLSRYDRRVINLGQAEFSVY
jgi:hypothetical protein